VKIERCPKCGRPGYLTQKLVTGSSRFQHYRYWYVYHKTGRPRWCYLGKQLPNSLKDFVPNDFQQEAQQHIGPQGWIRDWERHDGK
jgi:hypothetical protein